MLLNLYTSIIDLGHTIILCKFFFKFTMAVFRCIDLLKPTCISYAWPHRVESGVGAWYWLFTILGECVVSSEIGIASKIETYGYIKIIIINFLCLGEAIWGQSPPG